MSSNQTPNEPLSTAEARPSPEATGRAADNLREQTETGPSQPAFGADLQNSLHPFFQLAREHFGLIAESSKLVAAETRLALASTAQLFALGILGAFVGMFTWICLMVSVSILLHWLGLAIGWISVIMLVFHVVLLTTLGFAIRSTLDGMRFSATRELMGKSEPDKTDGQP